MTVSATCCGSPLSDGYTLVMELRRHPRMTYQGQPNWPPQWIGPFGPNNPLPSGEVGILVRVSNMSGMLDTLHCLLAMEWNHQEYFGFLYFDEEDFVQTFIRLAQSHVGRSIAEIGSLDIPDFT
ncbi:MAG TPA: hypothetical protein VF452_04255 [Candidatus Binatia bacterium]